MNRPRLAIAVGAFFGLVYVVVNAGPLESTLGRLVQVTAMVAFVVVLWLLREAGPVTVAGRSEPPRSFAAIVLAEVIAMAAGIIVINGMFDRPSAVLPWVSLVVGLHFVALGSAWSESSLTAVGAAVAVLGLIGLVLAVRQESFVVISAVSGIGPGVLLLGGSLWAARTLH